MIDELIERVERGEGADRELDGMVAAAMLPPQLNGWKPWACDGGYVLTETGEKPRPGMGQFMSARGYTASLDAVLALIEEKLPGAAIVTIAFDVQRKPETVRCAKAHVIDYGAGSVSLGNAASPARALLAAFLRAHKEQHDG